MVNEPVVAPAGMVTLDTVGDAIAALLLVNDTTMPPAGAAHSSVTVPLTVDPPVTGSGDSVTVFARIGRTVTSSVCETPPKLAVNFPIAGVVTVSVAMVNVTDDAPSGTVMLPGACAAAFVFVTATTPPPAGAP